MKRMYCRTVMLLGTLAWTGLAVISTSAKTAAEEVKVFLFAGQSNVRGADALVGDGAKDLAGLGIQTEADRNTRFTFGMHFSAADPIGYAWGDIRGHRGSSFEKIEPPVYVYGPEVGFARTLYAHGIRNVAIIAVSDNIPVPPMGPQWPWTNRDATLASPDYYGRWARFVDARLAELTQNGDHYAIAGFVWDEGIDDALNGATEAEYKTNLIALVAKLRSDYGTPTTPFLLVRSKSTMPSREAMDAVRAAQVAVAEADPRAAWVSSDDLPNVNIHHFPAASQLVIGQRLGEAYLALTHEPRSVR